MNNPIRQHFVPQLYLKNFALKKNKIWEISVKDKKNKKEYLSDIKNVAFEKNIYTIENQDDPYYWERYLSKETEPLMAATLDELIQNCSNVLLSENALIIDYDLKIKVADIMVSQLLRTPKGMNFLREIGKAEMPVRLKKIKKELSNSLPSNWREYLEKMVITDAYMKPILLDVSQSSGQRKLIKHALTGMTWIAYRIPKSSSISFHTSDHPVCIYHESKTPKTLFEIGISDPGTVIYYPINPQTLLGLYHRSMYCGSLSILDGMCERLKFDSGIQFVEKINKIVYEQCIQHTFSYPKNG